MGLAGGALVQHLLERYGLAKLMVQVRACVRACGRACVHACVRAYVRTCVRACVRTCVRACVCVGGRADGRAGRVRSWSALGPLRRGGARLVVSRQNTVRLWPPNALPATFSSHLIPARSPCSHLDRLQVAELQITEPRDLLVLAELAAAAGPDGGGGGGGGADGGGGDSSELGSWESGRLTRLLRDLPALLAAQATARDKARAEVGWSSVGRAVRGLHWRRFSGKQRQAVRSCIARSVLE